MKNTSKVKIYKCNTCGNLIFMLEDSGVIPVCCGSDMELLTAKTTDDYHEKHVPVIVRDGSKVTVTVGEVVHPMTDVHHINWILLETTRGSRITYLETNTEPAARFTLCDKEEIVAAYAYCNLHGFWKGTCC